MDPTDDRGAELIALNRELLALAEAVRASTRDAIQRAADTAENIRQLRLARALQRQRLAARSTLG